MGFTIAGLVLMIPVALLSDIGARARSDTIPPHHKPGIAFNPGAMAVFNLVWLVVTVAALTCLFLGSGWWAILLFPAGLLGAGVVLSFLKVFGSSARQ